MQTDPDWLGSYRNHIYSVIPAFAGTTTKG